jgi:hypothetical protein
VETNLDIAIPSVQKMFRRYLAQMQHFIITIFPQEIKIFCKNQGFTRKCPPIRGSMPHRREIPDGKWIFIAKTVPVPK